MRLIIFDVGFLSIYSHAKSALYCTMHAFIFRICVLCWSFLLADGVECDTVSGVFEGFKVCQFQVYRHNEDQIRPIYASFQDGSISQTDLREAMDMACSLSGQVFGCLSDTFADCTNYETELKPLTTNVGKMCYPNGSVSEELQNMLNRFTSFDTGPACKNSAMFLYADCPIPQPTTLGVPVSNFPELVETQVHEKLKCLVEKILGFDVSKFEQHGVRDSPVKITLKSTGIADNALF
ncbi:hypothetical protein ScPMuIL_000672 [Solemya velum]